MYWRHVKDQLRACSTPGNSLNISANLSPYGTLSKF